MTIKPGDLGIAIFRGHNPMEKPCNNCPFVMDADGQNYLHPDRMEALKFSATLGQPFACHKTVYRPGIPTEEDEQGFEQKPDFHPDYMQCAGANHYAQALALKLGITPTVIGKPFPEE